uniref:chitin synthase chs-2-like n=1 Tax=Myxine glutinosa TaxID=7769 RepID=UPI00358DDBF1
MMETSSERTSFESVSYTYMGENDSSWDDGIKEADIEEEESSSLWITFFRVIIFSMLFLVVLGSSTISMLCLLSLEMFTKETTQPGERLFLLWNLSLLLIFPNLISLMKSSWKLAFKTESKAENATIAKMCVAEFLAALGNALIVFLVMPSNDIISNLMVLGGVTLVPAFLQVVDSSKTSCKSISQVTSIIGLILCVLGFVLYGVCAFVREDKQDSTINRMSLLIIGLILVSVTWWENFWPNKNSGSDCEENINSVTLNTANVFGSLIRIVVPVIVVCSVVGWEAEKNHWSWSVLWIISSHPSEYAAPAVGLMACQACMGTLCHWLGNAACKICRQRSCFSLPLTLTLPVTGVSLWFMASHASGSNIWNINEWWKKGFFARNMTSFDCDMVLQSRHGKEAFTERLANGVARSICAYTYNTSSDNFLFKNPVESYDHLFESNCLSLTIAAGAFWWLGLIVITCHVWRRQTQRMEKTREMFVRRMYDNLCVAADMLLNRRYDEEYIEIKKYESLVDVDIYLCATMWHETQEEITCILTSIFRLDKQQVRFTLDRTLKQNQEMRQARYHREPYNMEAHIFFDDAFSKTNGIKHINEYAKLMVKVLIEIYGIFQQRQDEELWDSMGIPEFERPNKPLEYRGKFMKTKYGARLVFKMPCNNKLYVHLKDKDIIRHKKRWSQVMYMYYIMGWKTSSMINEEARRIKRENTYILALDGDTEFQPSAVSLLVDCLRRNPHVGATCGRIHPTGIGPLVWYQKFEYAVGHWLQKTTEHVLGCVLCSPGCFSLFRGTAIMDKNVLKQFTSVAESAAEHLQYDQGEDRWLCTLMLQRGWRVEYCSAADASTNAPQYFTEFYNQRRRWVPSAWVSIFDLLHTSSITARKNASFSTAYITYQLFYTASSLLGPASVCLLISGLLHTIFNVNASLSIVLSIIPPAFFLLICFKTKESIQINVALVLTVFYCIFTLISILIIAAEMSEDGPATLMGIFFLTLVLIHVGAALCHPQEFFCIIHGFVYAICSPSGYLLLLIYSLVNMNNVAWGTRESKAPDVSTEVIENEEKIDESKWSLEGRLCAHQPKTPTTDRVEHTQEEYQTLLVKYQQLKEKVETLVKTSRNIAVEYEDEPFLEDNDFPEGYADLKEKYDKLMKLGGELEKVFEDVNEYFTDIATMNKGQGVSRTYSHRNPTSRRHAVTVETLHQHFNEEVEEELQGEMNFWNIFIKRYLEPLNKDTKRKEHIRKELISLRNKATFLYIFINCLWVFATLVLEILGSTLEFHIPKTLQNANNKTQNGATATETLEITPIAFMFLIVFPAMLVIQFCAMVYYRVYTLLHIISFGLSQTKRKMSGYENEGLETDTIVSNEQISNSEENSTAIELSNRRSLHIFADQDEDSESDFEIQW